MKQSFLPLVVVLLMAAMSACNNNSPTQQASVLMRSKQADHLDRFESEIQAFEATDRQKMPSAGGVLFIGSSSIRLWEGIHEDFKGIKVINRGFGGSTIPEVQYFADRIVWKYKPRVIVFYCGENDLNGGEHPAQVFQNFKKLIADKQRKLPEAKFIVISAKPSPARWKQWKNFQLLNTMLEQFAASRPEFAFVDVGPLMLTENGQPDAQLFQEDKLHMNKQGYAKWVNILRPVIERMLANKEL
jgi:lysophospholipase L1-like esterase